jgi:hypothetical protein
MAFGRKVRVRRYKVEDRFEGEAYYVSPFTGGLFVFPLHDQERASLCRHARTLGIKIAAPLLTDGEFRESHIECFEEAGNRPDPVAESDFGRWARTTARKVEALRAFVPLPVLIEACRKRMPVAQRLSRNECLRSMRNFGPGQPDKCLAISLAQASYLSSHGVTCTLWIGCWPPTIDMHAWVTIGMDDSPAKKHDILVTEPLERVATYQPSLAIRFRG